MSWSRRPRSRPHKRASGEGMWEWVCEAGSLRGKRVRVVLFGMLKHQRGTGL